MWLRSKRFRPIAEDSSSEESEEETTSPKNTEDNSNPVISASVSNVLDNAESEELFATFLSDDEDEMGEPILNTEEESTGVSTSESRFKWMSATNKNTAVQPFNDLESGWKCDVDSETTEMALFCMSFPKDAITLCIEQTNKYGLENTSTSETARSKKWLPVTLSDMTKFIAIRLIMGINKLPEQCHYWSRDVLLGSKSIPSIMTSDRYIEIHRYLHFVDNSTITNESSRLIKLEALWNICNENFKKMMVPYKNLSFDESLLLWKGRLFWKQYIPKKRARFGIKIYSLVDSLTGFILNMRVYTGKGSELANPIALYGYGGSLALEVLSGYFNKNHHLYMDNYFNSPNTAEEFLNQGIHVCGTVKSNRKNLPNMKEKLKRGETRSFIANGIMVERWKDKKVVSMISTIHDHEMVETTSKSGIRRTKPKSILDYNKYARGIDTADMFMSLYAMTRKTTKWYKKLYMHLLDVCVYNAYVIFKDYHPNCPFLDFRMNLVRQLLLDTSLSPPRILQPTNNPLRLMNGEKYRHFPIIAISSKTNKPVSRRCQVCAHKTKVSDRKRKMTRYLCKECNVALCVSPCFEKYHTCVNY